MLYSSAGLAGLAFLFQALKLRKPAAASLALIIVFLGLYLTGRGFLGGLFFLNPLVEGPFFVPFCLTSISFFFTYKESPAALPVIGGTLAALLFACFYAKGIIPPTPNKITIWAVLFFLTENSAHACFIAGGLGALTWSEDKPGSDTFHRLLVWGFVLYSMSQIIGAWWAYIGWGNTFSWGPRHMSSAFLWLIYAAYIHLRFVQGWSMKRRAVWAVVSAVILIITVYGHHLHEMTFTRVGG